MAFYEFIKNCSDTKLFNLYTILNIYIYIFLKVFDRLRIENPDFTDLIKIIDCNLEDSSMGLTTVDRDWIVENVNFVFHCAATIKFNETLESASKINIQGTEKLLSLATQMKNLKVTYYIILTFDE